MSLRGGCSNRRCGRARRLRRGGAAVSVQKAGRLLAFGLTLLLLLQTSGRERAVSGQDRMTDIRVGLAALYAGKTELKITNTKIGLGYCIGDSYQTDLELTSSTGFVFTPAAGYYYSLAKTYAGYANAERAAALIRKLGVEAWPVSIYRNYWRVYVGGTSTQAEAEAVYEKIKDRYDYAYSALMPDNGHRLLVQADTYAFLIDGERMKAYPQFKALAADAKGNYVLSLGSRSYRGRIEIGRYGKGALTAVNIINVESYLYGVVPCEMQTSYESEALKAQAVCARSYALMKVGYSADSNISRAYYLDDTTSSQVYRGYGAEHARTTQAVDETSGEAVYYGGKMVSTYYFSTSGGSTENVGEVWGFDLDYLVAVPDIYETEPERQPWLIVYTADELAAKLAAHSLLVGTVQSVTPQVTTMTGRVYSLKIKGTKSSAILQTGTIREALSLYSTKFKVVKQGDVPDTAAVAGADRTVQARISECYVLSAGGAVEKAELSPQYIVMGADNLMNYPRSAPTSADTWYFYGMGYGHGVGMSQSGANGMAKAGYDYKQIITYYYQGCEVK